MTSKIQIWCPHCHKRYQIPQGLGARQLRCKKCSNSFAANDALTSEPTSAAVPSAAPVVNAEAVEVPRQPRQAEDLSSFFKQPQTEGVPIPSGQPAPSQPAPGNVRHVSSPMMIPAVIGAVLFSLLLCGLAFGYSWYRTYSIVADHVDDPSGVSRDDEIEREPKADFGAVPKPKAPRAEIAQPGGQNKVVSVPPDDAAQVRSEGIARMEADEAARKTREADRVARLQAERSRDQEQRAAEKAAAEKREAQRVARAQTREDEKAKKLKEVKKARLTAKPDESPTDNLLLRIRVAGPGVKSAAITDQFLITGKSEVVRVYDWPSHSEVFELSELKDQFQRVTALAVSPDFKRLAIGGANGAVGVYQLLSSGYLAAPEKFMGAQKNEITQMVFNQDATRIVSVSNRQEVNLWDVEAFESIKQIELPRASVWTTDLAAVKDDFHFTNGKSTQVHSFDNGRLIKKWESDLRGLVSIAISPSGDHTAVTKGSEINVVDSKGRQLSKVRGKDGVNWSIAFLDENTLLVGNRGGLTKWDIKRGKVLQRFDIPDASYIKLLKVSLDRNQVIASSSSSSDDVFLINLSGEPENR